MGVVPTLQLNLQNVHYKQNAVKNTDTYITILSRRMKIKFVNFNTLCHKQFLAQPAGTMGFMVKPIYTYR